MPSRSWTASWKTVCSLADYVAFDAVVFQLVCDMQRRLHNRPNAMTFDEQRDFAERLRLLLEQGVPLDEGDLIIPKT